MLGNVFTKSLHQIADTRLSQDQSLLAEMWELQIRLNSGHFDDAWVDALMQPYNRPYGVHDAFGFAILWSALLRGDIYHAVCDIGEHCGADRLVERNNRAVSGLTQLAAGDGPSSGATACFMEACPTLTAALRGWIQWPFPVTLAIGVQRTSPVPTRSSR